MRTKPFLIQTAAAVALAAIAASSGAAQAVAIDSAMTKAQVIERFGKPASERTRGEFTYLFFSNGREKQVGTADIVTLQADKVIDAVLRSPRRTYSGKSSSPRALNSKEAKGPNAGAPLKRGGAGG
jgi:hypothetical protein